MSLQRVGKNSALRVAFLTDSRFDKEDALANGNLKKRALRCIHRQVRYPVVEHSTAPDVYFYIMRQPGSQSWMLRKAYDAKAIKRNRT